MKLTWFRIASVTLILGCPEVTWGDVFEGDARFDQLTTVHAEGISTRELLNAVSIRCGIELVAGHRIAEQRVIVLEPPRMLKYCLRDVAGLLNASWRRSGSRFTLDLDAAAVRLEDHLSRRSTRAIEIQLERQVDALRESPEELARRPDGDPIKEFLAKDILHCRAATELYSALGPSQREKLLASSTLSIPVRSIGGSHISRVREVFRAIVSSEQAVQAEQAAKGYGVAASRMSDFDSAVIEFQVRRSSNSASIQVRFGRMANMLLTQVDIAQVNNLPPHGNPYTGASVGALPPGTEKVLTHQPSLPTAWPDMLVAMHHLLKTPVLSDYYCTGQGPATAGLHNPAKSTDASVSWLDERSRAEEYIWWCSSDALYFRKRDWFDRRHFDLPEKWLTALFSALKKANGGPSYEVLVSVSELTDKQMAGLNNLVRAESSEVDFVGLRELLALVKATPQLRSRQIFDGNSFTKDDNTWASTLYKYGRPSIGQERAFQRFLVTRGEVGLPRKLNDIWFRGSCSPPNIKPGGRPLKYHSVKAEIGIDRFPKSSYTVYLPFEPWDDRSSRTRIEVTPP